MLPVGTTQMYPRYVCYVCTCRRVNMPTTAAKMAEPMTARMIG